MSGFDVFDDDGNPTIDPLDPFGTAKAEEERFDRLQQNAEATNQDGKITVKTFGEKLAEDEESGASIRVDDGEAQGSLDENGGSIHVRASKVNADTGTALGPVKLDAHGPEADGYGSVSSGKVGLGGHLDAAGVDAQVGDDGTHVKAGVSLGVGLGAEFATGEDTDGDGYGEWGMRGEGGPLSASARFEPGAVYDGAAEAADAAPGLAQDFADDPAGTLQGIQAAIDEDAGERVENASALRYLRDELGDTLGTATDPLGGIAGGINAPGGALEDTFTTPAAIDGPAEYEVTPPADANFTAPPGDAYLDPGPALEQPLATDSPLPEAPVDTHAEPAYVEPAPVDTYAEPAYAEPAPVEPAYAEPAPVDTYAEPAYAEPAPVDTYAEPAYVEPAPTEEAYVEETSLDY